MYALTLLLALVAQRPDSLAAQVREYVAVDTSLLALTHALLIDGTGGAPKTDQTIVIRAGRIATVGPAASLPIGRRRARPGSRRTPIFAAPSWARRSRRRTGAASR